MEVWVQWPGGCFALRPACGPSLGETHVSSLASHLWEKHPDVEEVKAASHRGSLQPPVH